MKKIYVILALVLAGFSANAQQDPLFTQYLFNGLAINPAYAGTRGAFSGIAYYRNQWVGMEGAPTTFNASLHTPFEHDKFALGFNITHDAISVQKNTNISAIYAYRIAMKGSVLSMGLSGTVQNYRYSFDGVRTTTPNDPAFVGQNINRYKPNFGLGTYWYGEKFFLGASLPNLLAHNVVDNINANAPSKMVRHLFLTGGYLIQLDPSWEFKPSSMVKIAPNAPIQFDFSGTFYYNQFLGVGASLRNFDAIAVMLQVRPTEALWIGYSYDIAVNGLNGTNRGSHDIFVGFDINVGNPAIKSPRYF